MLIKSNVNGKLEKILSGKVFSSPLTFITELFQNSYRAQCENVTINLDGNSISIYDDGIGLKSPQAILTFDTSDWEHTTDGFGMGFWSTLGIPDTTSIEVFSNNTYINIDMDKIKRGDLDIDVKQNDSCISGFKTIIKSDFIENYKDDIIKEIKEVGKYMPYKVKVDDKYIFQESLEDTVYGDYIKDYDTRWFTARLAVTKGSYDNAEIYYENRLVCSEYKFAGVRGIIKLKKNAVNLKEPDRTSIVYDSKRARYTTRLKECIRDLYKNFLTEIYEDDEKMDDYSQIISRYLGVNEYSKYLLIDKDIEISLKDKLVSIENSLNNDEIKICKIENLLKEETESTWEFSGEIQEECDTNSKVNSIDNKLEEQSTIIIGNKIFNRRPDENILEEKEEEHNNVKSEIAQLKDVSDFSIELNNENLYVNQKIKAYKNVCKLEKKNIRDIVGKNKLVMWVRMNEFDKYSDCISRAEYNGVKVIKSRNELFEKYFVENNIPHIDKIDSCVDEYYKYEDINPINGKEEKFLLLLEPIRKLFGLEKGIFKIGNIEQEINFYFNDKKIKSKRIKNTSKKTIIYGACSSEGGIILDRRAMNLKRFNLNLTPDDFKIGINELKCIMFNLDTISHELAHYLYKTIDNTKAHLEHEKMIQEKIIEFLIDFK